MKEKQNGDGSAENASVHEDQQMPVIIHAQYVKDISFENPNAPETLRAGQKGPEMDVNINMDARKIESSGEENFYEVTLVLTAKAFREKQSVFLAEIHYGALISMPGVSEENHHPLLLIEIPKTLFPFARQLMAELTQSGGYPPLLLNPVDFHALYLQQFDKEKAEEPENPGS
jgi:preprotein translocase subunit SecB